MNTDELIKAKKAELLALGKEQAQREEEITEEWYKTHERNGYDGGPVLQLKALNEQFSKRYLEIMRKYEQKLKDSEDKK